MKIIQVKTHLLKKSLSSTMRISRGGFDTRYHCIVQVVTDQGIYGLGEAIGNAPLLRSILDGGFADRILGKDPRNISLISGLLLDSDVYFERMGSVICAASALEMACWDIKAKALGLPLHELLGGARTDRLEAYASDIYWQESAQAMADEAQRICALGYRKIKVHIGAASAREDYRRLAAIRQAIGPDIELMVDLNGGYDYPMALEALRRWRELDLYWLEEPVDANNIEAMRRLREKSDIPIAAGENEFRLHGFQQLFAREAVDIAMPDLGRTGGIAETRKVCALAQAAGIRVSPHNFSSGVLLAATMHVLAVEEAAFLLEMDTSANAVIGEFFREPLVFEDGCLRLPDTPGIGVELNEQVLAYAS